MAAPARAPASLEVHAIGGYMIRDTPLTHDAPLPRDRCKVVSRSVAPGAGATAFGQTDKGKE